MKEAVFWFLLFACLVPRPHRFQWIIILGGFSVFRAANNGRSTDNVRSELGIDRSNPWIAGHIVRSFTDSFRESLIFNYLIITRDNIHVSEIKNTRI